MSLRTNTPTTLLGIDGGGTGVRIRLEVAGTTITRGHDGSANPHRAGIDTVAMLLDRAIDEVLEAAGDPRVDGVCLGLAGCSHPEALAMVTRAWPRDARPRATRLVSDAAIAHATAFADRPGVLVAAGTGSIALCGRAEQTVQLGGLGPLLGDEGSGHQLALEALRHAARVSAEPAAESRLLDLAREAFGHDVRGWHRQLTRTPDAIARFLPQVAEAAAARDEVAVAILEQGGRDLARLAMVGAQALADGPVPVEPGWGDPRSGRCSLAITGSVLLRLPIVSAAFRAACGLEDGVEPIRVEDATEGALTLAARALASDPPTRDW